MQSTTFNALSKYRKYTELIASDPANRSIYQHQLQKYQRTLQKDGFDVSGFKNRQIPLISEDLELDDRLVGGAGEEIKTFDQKAVTGLTRDEQYEAVNGYLASGTKWLTKNKSTNEQFMTQVVAMMSDVAAKINEMDGIVNHYANLPEDRKKGETDKLKDLKQQEIAKTNDEINKCLGLLTDLKEYVDLNKDQHNLALIQKNIKKFEEKITLLIANMADYARRTNISLDNKQSASSPSVVAQPNDAKKQQGGEFKYQNTDQTNTDAIKNGMARAKQWFADQKNNKVFSEISQLIEALDQKIDQLTKGFKTYTESMTEKLSRLNKSSDDERRQLQVEIAKLKSQNTARFVEIHNLLIQLKKHENDDAVLLKSVKEIIRGYTNKVNGLIGRLAPAPGGEVGAKVSSY